MITRGSWEAMSDEERAADLKKRLDKQNRDLVGVCVHPADAETADIPNFLFLVGEQATLRAIRAKIQDQLIKADPTFNEVSALYLFVDNIVPCMTSTLGSLHAEHKSADGFLHIKYGKESVFGAV